MSFITFSDVLRFEGTNPDAIFVRGLCLYYQDNTEKAFQHFQHVLRFAPDHPKAKLVYKVSRKWMILSIFLFYYYCRSFLSRHNTLSGSLRNKHVKDIYMFVVPDNIS